MPPSTERDDLPKNVCPSSDPFTSFAKFIDERLSHMLQSIVGLPSSKEDMESWKPWEELQRKDRHPWGWGYDEKHKLHQKDGESPRDSSEPHYMGLCGQAQRQTTKLHAVNSALEDLQGRSKLLRQDDDERCFITTRTLDKQIGDHETEHYSVLHSNQTSQQRPIVHDGIERCGASEGLSRLELYLATSPYSPTNLENDPQLQPFAWKWRGAFTDLMNESQGGVLPSLNQNPLLSTRRLEPSTWRSLFLMNFGYNFHITSMRNNLTARNATSLLDPMALAIFLSSAERMSADIGRHQRTYRKQMKEFHPELLGSDDDYYGEADHQYGMEDIDEEEGDDEQDVDDHEDDEDEDDEDEEDEEEDDEAYNYQSEDESATELDMMEELLHKMSNDDPGKPGYSLSNQTTGKEPSEQERARPSIISRLTTIERVTKPDGTIETRRVLRTRFSDGSENTEMSQDVVVGHGQSQPANIGSIQLPRETEIMPVEATKTESTGGTKSGWFWRRTST